MADDSQALSLHWAFGLSTNVRDNIVNLSDANNDRVCYVAAHTAVIYDKRSKRQTFLQGHCNAITCIAATEDRTLLVTADTGPDPLVVVWDTRTGQPARTLAQPHAYGVCAVALSHDGCSMVTVSAPVPGSGEQEVGIWDLRALVSGTGEAKPLVVMPIPVGDEQRSAAFNGNDPTEFSTNGSRRVYFWRASLQQKPAALNYYSPPLRSTDFKQTVGDFITSVFVPGSSQALTSTVDGDVVIWDEQGLSAQMGTRATDRKALKVMRLHHTPIRHLSTIGDFVVTGADDGLVRFFDAVLRIAAWFEDIEAGPITGVSFATAGPQGNNANNQLNRFTAPDFVVATSRGRIVAVESGCFEEGDREAGKGEVLLEAPTTDVVDIAAHPLRPEFAVLGAGGLLQRWDLSTHRCLASRQFAEGAPGSCLASARDASFLAVGCSSGHLYVVNGDSLEDVSAHRNTGNAIERLAVSSSGQHIAAADISGQVLMYMSLPYKRTSMYKWELIGKYNAHHGSVAGLSFGESPSGETRLFSVGKDGRLLEYDLLNPSPSAGLSHVSMQDVRSHGTGRPTALCFAPPMPYFSSNSTDTLLLLADDAFKVRAYSADRSCSCATFLGPTYGGGPIRDLQPFRSASSGGTWLAFTTGVRVVGLMAWPMDGDPQHSMGLIAHPGDVSCLAVSFDGRKLLTADNAGIINTWDVHTQTLEGMAARASAASAAMAQAARASFSSSGDGTAAAAPAARTNSRWASVIGDAELLQEMADYFVYAQVKAGGKSSAEARRIDGRVHVSALADLMRAAGYYPSQAETRAMLAHVRFLAGMSSEADDTAEDADSIDFDTFLALYVNHRPVVPISTQDIAAALEKLGGGGANGGSISRARLLQLLTSAGEALSKEELSRALTALTGSAAPEAAMDDFVDAAAFSSEVLGFEEAAVAAA